VGVYFAMRGGESAASATPTPSVSVEIAGADEEFSVRVDCDRSKLTDYALRHTLDVGFATGAFVYTNDISSSLSGGTVMLRRNSDN
jgi:hypothetical protein